MYSIVGIAPGKGQFPVSFISEPDKHDWLFLMRFRVLPRNFGKMTFQRNWEKWKQVMA